MFKKFTVLFVLAILLLFAVSVSAQTTAKYDTVTIHDIQYVDDPATHEESYMKGDTVVVKAMVTSDPRALWVGSRWAIFACDGTNDPWSGFFIIQNDTVGDAANTFFQYLLPGDEAYFTGVIDEYTGLTQMALLTQPGELVPVDVVSTGNTIPDPKVLTLADIDSQDVGEQWESMLVRVNDAQVTNSAASSNQAIIDDGTGTGSIDDYFGFFRYQFDNNTYEWPANGTMVNVTGFTRDLSGVGNFSINPRDDKDVEVLSFPPEISFVDRVPGVPSSSDVVTVKAVVTDNVMVQSAMLHYSVDDADFAAVAMTAATGDTFTAEIPALPNNSHLRYFVSAEDNSGDSSQLPGDTTTTMFQYVIRDGGLNIMDVQYDYNYNGDSPFRYYDVTLEGVVTTDSTNYIGNYYIQDKDSAWHGIWIRDTQHKPLKGDWVRVSGTVEENYGVTRLNNITSYEVVSSGNPFEPVDVTTGEISTTGANGEAYESVLVRIANLTVTDPFPDAPGNYGEFTVDDGSGGVRVDDAMNTFNGNLDSTFHLNDTIEEMIGIHYYSFGDYKLLPRSNDDVIGHVVGINDRNENVTATYQLDQNYPNPFNPETTIRFNVPERSQVTLAIFNVLGQKVRTLFSGIASPGAKELRWNGLDDNGAQMGTGIYFYRLQSKNFTMTKKMMLIK